MEQEKKGLNFYNQAIFEGFFQVISDIFFLLDENGKILDYRAEKSNALYAPPEAFVNKKIDQILPEEVAGLVLNNLKEAIESCEMTNFDYELMMQDGLKHYECRMSFLPEIRLCIAVVRDMTKQHEVMQELAASRRSFQVLLEKAPFPIFITSLRDHTFQYVNKRALEQFEASNDKEGIGMPARNYYVNPKDRELFLEQLQKNGTVNDLEIYMKTFRNRKFWGLMSAGIAEYDNEPCIIVAINDITQRKEMEDNLRISEEKYRLLTEYTSDVIWIMNLTKQKYTYMSPSVEQMRGYTAEEVLNQTLEESISKDSIGFIEDDIPRGVEEFLKNPYSPNSYIIQVQQPCKDGTFIWVEVSLKFRFNEKKEVELVGVTRNIDKRKKAEEEVIYLSFHDQLTGLYNRRFYEEELKRLDTQRNLPITLVMADVNGLKMTNDAFGHLVGDQMLKNFAESLKQECRSNDVVARIGGDEFVILLINTDSAQAETEIKRINAAISNQRNDIVNLSVSFGWQTKYTMEESMEDIYKLAEDFMYRKKLLEGKSYKSDTIRLITSSLYEKDELERLHSEKVSELCRNLGTELGLSAAAVNELGLAGLLHDIGKIGINEQLLGEKADLNDAQWVDLKRHPEVGYQLLRSVSEFANIAEFVLGHHERLDGTGYPRGLEAADIRMESRVITIAEAYDFMTREYPYKPAYSTQKAIEELKKHAGTQFDLNLAKVFVERVLQEAW